MAMESVYRWVVAEQKIITLNSLLLSTEANPALECYVECYVIL